MLAALADVKRLLRLSSTTAEVDAQLQGALEAADSWARGIVGDLDATTQTTLKKYDIREDAFIGLPRGATVAQVRGYTAPAGPATIFDANGYDSEGDGVRLRQNFLVTPSEFVTARRLSGTWVRVEIDYTPTGSVPASVRDAVALAAMIVYKRAPALAMDLGEEQIGDYSYALRHKVLGEPDFLEPARILLRGHSRRRISVTG